MNEPVSYAEFSRVMDKLCEAQKERNEARRQRDDCESRLINCREWVSKARELLEDTSCDNTSLAHEYLTNSLNAITPNPALTLDGKEPHT